MSRRSQLFEFLENLHILFLCGGILPSLPSTLFLFILRNFKTSILNCMNPENQEFRNPRIQQTQNSEDSDFSETEIQKTKDSKKTRITTLRIQKIHSSGNSEMSES